METQKENQLKTKHKTFLKLINNTNFPISSGIECDNGWYKLIDETITEILELCKKYKVKSSIQITQIKEKMGELIIYFNSKPENNEILNVINCVTKKASIKSKKICEICSRKGSLRNYNGRMKTTCWRCHLIKLWNKYKFW